MCCSEVSWQGSMGDRDQVILVLVVHLSVTVLGYLRDVLQAGKHVIMHVLINSMCYFFVNLFTFF